MAGPPRPVFPSAPSEPSLRRLGVGGSGSGGDRPLRAQIVVALVILLMLIAVPLYLWRRPSASDQPAADHSAPPDSAAPAASALPGQVPFDAGRTQERVRLAAPQRVKCSASAAGHGQEGSLCDSLALLRGGAGQGHSRECGLRAEDRQGGHDQPRAHGGLHSAEAPRLSRSERRMEGTASTARDRLRETRDAGSGVGLDSTQPSVLFDCDFGDVFATGGGHRAGCAGRSAGSAGVRVGERSGSGRESGSGSGRGGGSAGGRRSGERTASECERWCARVCDLHVGTQFLR